MPASQPANRPSKIPIFGKKNLLVPRVSQTAVSIGQWLFTIFPRKDIIMLSVGRPAAPQELYLRSLSCHVTTTGPMKLLLPDTVLLIHPCRILNTNVQSSGQSCLWGPLAAAGYSWLIICTSLRVQFAHSSVILRWSLICASDYFPFHSALMSRPSFDCTHAPFTKLSKLRRYDAPRAPSSRSLWRTKFHLSLSKVPAMQCGPRAR